MNDEDSRLDSKLMGSLYYGLYTTLPSSYSLQYSTAQ